MDLLTLEIALQEGMTAEVKEDKITITINTKITNRDFEQGKLEYWLSKKDSVTAISSGCMKIVKNKLSWKGWR